jgi:hypothetical protein
MSVRPSQADRQANPALVASARRAPIAGALVRGAVSAASALAVVTSLGSAAAEPPAKPASPKPPRTAAGALPPAPARIWLVTPTPSGPWTLRIDNTGEHTIRIPADVRLLRLELEASDGKHRTKTVRCDVGALRPEHFPDRRALYLSPLESYVETFDPRLVCFGKSAAELAGSAAVKARFGWDPPPKGSKKPLEPPFVADGIDDPAFFSPLRELVAPTVVLSYDDGTSGTEVGPEPAGEPSGPAAATPAPTAAEPASPSPSSGNVVVVVPLGAPAAPAAETPAAPAPLADTSPPIVDANAPRLELAQEAMADARTPSQVTVTVTATNVGHRPLVAPLHARMLEFRVHGPDDRRTRCDAAAPTHAVPRDLYRTFKPGASASFTVQLNEVCPLGTFDRPGLYRVHAVLRARETGSEVGLDAYTADVPGVAPTLVRVQGGPLPFYWQPPVAVATQSLGSAAGPSE